MVVLHPRPHRLHRQDALGGLGRPRDLPGYDPNLLYLRLHHGRLVDPLGRCLRAVDHLPCRQLACFCPVWLVGGYALRHADLSVVGAQDVPQHRAHDLVPRHRLLVLRPRFGRGRHPVLQASHADWPQACMHQLPRLHRVRLADRCDPGGDLLHGQARHGEGARRAKLSHQDDCLLLPLLPGLPQALHRVADRVGVLLHCRVRLRIHRGGRQGVQDARRLGHGCGRAVHPRRARPHAWPHLWRRHRRRCRFPDSAARDHRGRLQVEPAARRRDRRLGGRFCGAELCRCGQQVHLRLLRRRARAHE
mmetsp:Transcript_27643/g.70422  ORF Transcript_27643/g.70422 Transcript_27643/m.70422 type:complete len:305 (-) Transcript_27643:1184-2098(-)